MYRMGVSQKDAKAITGLQDNGTKLKQNNGNWSDVLGGDGMQCAIHPTNPSVMYGCIQKRRNHKLQATEEVTGLIFRIISRVNRGEPGSHLALHASNANFVVAGYKEVYKSNNQAARGRLFVPTFEFKPELPICSTIRFELHLHSKRDSLYKTKNGGTTWTKHYTPGGNISNFCIHPTNPEILLGQFAAIILLLAKRCTNPRMAASAGQTLAVLCPILMPTASNIRKAPKMDYM